MKDFVIQIENLSKRYILKSENKSYRLLSEEIGNFFRISKRKSGKFKNRDYWALKNINLKIKKGEVLGVIGPNGAGKSTLLKILSQITYPTDGLIKIKGKVASLLEVGTGFSPELTGRENIYLNGSILGMSHKEIEKKIGEIIKFSGITKFIDQPVKQYSSGMYIRLAFSVAAFLDSDILLIDEILSVGDANFQRKSLGKVNDITKNQSKTVIFVSHDLNSITKLCTRAILIEGGKIRKSGPPSQVTNYYLDLMAKSSILESRLENLSARTGSHEIYINNIKLISTSDPKGKVVKTGDDFCIRIQYKVKKEVQISDLMVGIFVKSDWGEPMFEEQNSLYGIDFGVLKGSGYFEFCLKDLPLASGTYTINCALLKNNGVGGNYYDNIDDAIRFEVQKSDYFGHGLWPIPEHGRIYLKGKWNHVKKSGFS